MNDETIQKDMIQHIKNEYFLIGFIIGIVFTVLAVIMR